jgi:hypothetical protein
MRGCQIGLPRRFTRTSAVGRAQAGYESGG